jgi:hypothetical protein
MARTRLINALGSNLTRQLRSEQMREFGIRFAVTFFEMGVIS